MISLTEPLKALMSNPSSSLKYASYPRFGGSEGSNFLNFFSSVTNSETDRFVLGVTRIIKTVPSATVLRHCLGASNRSSVNDVDFSLVDEVDRSSFVENVKATSIAGRRLGFAEELFHICARRPQRDRKSTRLNP